MASWETDATTTHPLDFRLVQNGFATLFYRLEVVHETTRWLAEHGYTVVEMDSATWDTEPTLHHDFARAFDFPSYYGSNLSALRECLSDVALGEYGWDSAHTGLVLVLTRFDAFLASHAALSTSVLNVLSDTARYALLFGHRVLVLVQSDNPQLRVPSVGASTIQWNSDEWFDSHRV